MSRWTRIAVAIVGVLAIAIVALFALVNANTFRPLLETQLTAALGRHVTLGNLRFAPFSGSLIASDLVIAGDPDYSTEPFLTAKELRIGVSMKPLIFTRRLEVLSFEAEKPQIHLVRGADGTWNFSTIGRNAASETERTESAIPHLTVGLVEIRNGGAIVENFPANGSVRVYDHLNLSVRQFSFMKRFSFTLSAGLPGGGKVSMNGYAGPINQQDAAMTALDAQISVQHLEPIAAGFLDPNVGVSMLVDVDAHATSDGQVVNSSGTVHMQRLRLGKTGSPSPRPVDLTYDVSQNLQDKTGQLHSADIEIGKAAIHLSGVYRVDPGDPWLNMRVVGQNLPIDHLQSLMTAAGVKLPNDAVLHGGTLTIDLGVAGLANSLVITGPVGVDNTRLVGFDLGSKISGIAALGGIKTGDTTDIQKLRLNLSASNDGLKVDKIDSVMPVVGEARGSGTVSPAGVLAFQLVVNVSAASGLSKIGVGLLTKMNGTAGPAVKGAAVKGGSRDGIRGVPIQVTGTAANPVIKADVTGVMRRHAAAVRGKLRENTPKAVFEKLFGKNKKKK